MTVCKECCLEEAVTSDELCSKCNKDYRLAGKKECWRCCGRGFFLVPANPKETEECPHCKGEGKVR